MFLAENPEDVVKRIVYAFTARYQASLHLKYNFYIDCIPTDESTQSMPQELLKNIIKRSIGTSKINEKIFSGQVAQELTNELNLEYMRTLNKIMFDKEVRFV
jgi:dynein heavy chain